MQSSHVRIHHDAIEESPTSLASIPEERIVELPHPGIIRRGPLQSVSKTDPGFTFMETISTMNVRLKSRISQMGNSTCIVGRLLTVPLLAVADRRPIHDPRARRVAWVYSPFRPISSHSHPISSHLLSPGLGCYPSYLNWLF